MSSSPASRQARARGRMPDLSFEVVGARAVAFAASPLLHLELEVRNEPPTEEVACVALQCQVQIEAQRRRYGGGEQHGLEALFGDPSRWDSGCCGRSSGRTRRRWSRRSAGMSRWSCRSRAPTISTSLRRATSTPSREVTYRSSCSSAARSSMPAPMARSRSRACRGARKLASPSRWPSTGRRSTSITPTPRA